MRLSGKCVVGQEKGGVRYEKECRGEVYVNKRKMEYFFFFKEKTAMEV